MIDLRQEIQITRINGMSKARTTFPDNHIEEFVSRDGLIDAFHKAASAITAYWCGVDGVDMNDTDQCAWMYWDMGKQWAEMEKMREDVGNVREKLNALIAKIEGQL